MAEKKVEKLVGDIGSGKQCLCRRYTHNEYRIIYRPIISFH